MDPGERAKPESGKGLHPRLDHGRLYRNPGTPCTAKTPCLPPGGTTLNDIGFQVVKRLGKDIEVNGNFTVEHWTAPIYMPGQQTVTTTDIQVTWFPNRRVNF